MANERITEQESLYNNLQHKPVIELLTDINCEDKNVALVVSGAIDKIQNLVTVIVEKIRSGGRVFYIGAGTSGRLGVLDAAELPPTYGIDENVFVGIIAGGDIALRKSVEHAEDDREAGWDELVNFNVNSNDLILGIAASGTTPYVVGALERAKENSIFTAALTCNPNTRMSAIADLAIEVIVGPEYVSGSTRMKAGTAQKLVLNMISTATMIQLGYVIGNRMVNMKPLNDKLIDRGVRMIMSAMEVDYDTALQMLNKYGSVRKAIDAGTNNQGL